MKSFKSSTTQYQNRMEVTCNKVTFLVIESVGKGVHYDEEGTASGDIRDASDT